MISLVYLAGLYGWGAYFDGRNYHPCWGTFRAYLAEFERPEKRRKLDILNKSCFTVRGFLARVLRLRRLAFNKIIHVRRRINRKRYGRVE